MYRAAGCALALQLQNGFVWCNSHPATLVCGHGIMARAAEPGCAVPVDAWLLHGPALQV
jgi:hypothetical protein